MVAIGCRGLVTGASRGLGFHAARALARLGCSLVVSARGFEGLKAASEELRRGYGIEVYPVTVDLRVEGDVSRLMDEAFKLLGGLDVVVMSYGNPSCEPCMLHEASWSDYIEAAALYIASTAYVLKRLIEDNDVKATFISISSFTVKEPHPPLIVSDALRSGLAALIKAAARSYPERIRPLLLLLGSFDTPGARRTIEVMAERSGENPEEYWRGHVEGISPLRRVGGLDEFEEIVTWLVRSPEYMTGSIITFDGATSRCI